MEGALLLSSSRLDAKLWRPDNLSIGALHSFEGITRAVFNADSTRVGGVGEGGQGQEGWGCTLEGTTCA